MILHLFVPIAVQQPKHFSSLERIYIKILISPGMWLLVMCLRSLCVGLSGIIFFTSQAVELQA